MISADLYQEYYIIHLCWIHLSPFLSPQVSSYRLPFGISHRKQVNIGNQYWLKKNVHPH